MIWGYQLEIWNSHCSLCWCDIWIPYCRIWNSDWFRMIGDSKVCFPPWSICSRLISGTHFALRIMGRSLQTDAIRQSQAFQVWPTSLPFQINMSECRLNIEKLSPKRKFHSSSHNYYGFCWWIFWHHQLSCPFAGFRWIRWSGGGSGGWNPGEINLAFIGTKKYGKT